MSFEFTLSPCVYCHKVFGKRSNQSRNRRESQAYCSLECGRADMKVNERGWWGFGMTTIKKTKSLDDIAPKIWTDEEFKAFDQEYPELASF